MKSKFLGIVFDGTTHLSEALAIVIKFVNESWDIEQCLIKILLLVKRFSSEEITQELINMFSANFSITSNYAVAACEIMCQQNCCIKNSKSSLFLSVGCWLLF